MLSRRSVWPAMPQGHREQGSVRRQDSTQQSNGGLASSPWGIAVIVLVAIVLLLTGLLLVYSNLRKLRLQHRVPKYLPGSYLKRKYMAWKPRGKYSTLDDVEETATQPVATEVTQPATTSTNVDRHTSVRSIISLPAYSRTPKETEEVIGREGERAGIDTVVEFPETAEEEEGHREEEMESLYQIRQTRRQEIAEREERRRQRREAREAGDFTRLEELRRETRQRRDQNSSISSNVNLTAEAMIQEHNARGRSRRVSSVSYAALGQVRHDGSRLRTESRDSERRGLLGQAAPMGSVPPLPHSRHGSEATSLLSMNTASRTTTRQRSDSGAPSVSSVSSSFDNVSRSEARPLTTRTNSSHNAERSSSNASSDEADIGDEPVEPVPVQPGTTPEPPTYDAHDWGDAPAYEEEQRRLSRLLSLRTQNQQQHDEEMEPLTQVDTRAPQLPSLHVTPTIHIETPTQPNSPAVSRGAGFSPITRDDPELR